jgi:LemA protein
MRAEWIVLAVLAAAVAYVVVVYNRLVRARNLVGEGWSGIDVQLRRRSDLVPNLVDVVKAYAAHERALFADIADKRNSAINAIDVSGKATAERELQGSLRQLLALAEAYPALKANQNFLALQNELADLEDHLQMARRYYNGTVRDYNTAIQSFPDMLIARPAGFRAADFFQADEADGAPPAVDFSGSRP